MFMQFLEFHYVSIQFTHIFSSNVYDVFHYYTLFINIDFSKKNKKFLESIKKYHKLLYRSDIIFN